MNETLQENQTRERDEMILTAFKQHKEKFAALLKSGMFDVQSGQVEVNIHNNQIQSIYLRQLSYKRKSYPQISP